MSSCLIFGQNKYLHTSGTLFLIFEKKNFLKFSNKKIWISPPNVPVVCTYSSKYFLRQKVLSGSPTYFGLSKKYLLAKELWSLKKNSKKSRKKKPLIVVRSRIGLIYIWPTCVRDKKLECCRKPIFPSVILRSSSQRALFGDCFMGLRKFSHKIRNNILGIQ